MLKGCDPNYQKETEVERKRKERQIIDEKGGGERKEKSIRL